MRGKKRTQDADVETTDEVIEELGDSVGFARLTKDLRQAAETLTVGQARYLVDTYYQIQQFRIEAANIGRSGTEAAEPSAFVAWVARSMATLERAIVSALDRYTSAHEEGRWAKSISGIGPVLAAGLMAHVDPVRARTAGAVWRFAGLDPTLVWAKETKRPYNARLKVLCYKVGESFVKVQALEDDFYGKVYVQRKTAEWKKNEAGEFREAAAKALARLKADDSQAKAWNSGRYTPPLWTELSTLPLAARGPFLTARRGEPGSGVPMLAPAHIHARARRYAVKLFLAHYHHVATVVVTGAPPPMPYVIEHGGHTHFIAPPKWR